MGILPDPTFSGIYDGFHRIAWAACFSWIIYMIVADVEDKEETIATKIFGNSVFIFIGRLSLTAYVVHPLVQLLLLSTQQTHLFSGPILMVSVCMSVKTIILIDLQVDRSSISKNWSNVIYFIVK